MFCKELTTMKLNLMSTCSRFRWILVIALFAPVTVLFVFALFFPVAAQRPTATPVPTAQNNGTMPVTGTMTMAEMGAQMDKMMAHMPNMMASMSMTSTMSMMGDGMSMHEIGQMMQMMGMMHQRMGQMQMMMGAMMTGDTTQDGSTEGGMMEESATPEPSKDTREATNPSEISEPATTKEEANHAAPTLATEPQTATVGAITIEATPLTPKELLEIAFTVTLETHSVDLNFDLAERATLTIDQASFPATSWEPDASSGHHVSGILRFTIDHPAHAALSEAKNITLNLDEIDSEPATLTFPLMPE
jgi:hypothetical protein